MTTSLPVLDRLDKNLVELEQRIEDLDRLSAIICGLRPRQEKTGTTLVGTPTPPANSDYISQLKIRVDRLENVIYQATEIGNWLSANFQSVDVASPSGRY